MSVPPDPHDRPVDMADAVAESVEVAMSPEEEAAESRTDEI